MLFALLMLGFYLSDLFRLPSSILRVRGINKKEFFVAFFLCKNVSLFRPERTSYAAYKAFFRKKESLLPSNFPPFIMDPKSMLVELRPPTMVELRAVVELRSLS